MSERVMIFMDAPNFQQHLKRGYFGKFVNWAKLFEKLARTREVVEIHFHTTQLDPKVDVDKYNKHQRFLGGLQKDIPNFTPAQHRMQKIDGKYSEKDVDQSLCGLMGLNAGGNRFDTAILVAADRDYVNTVKMVRGVGKRVEVAMFDYALADELKGVADQVIYITEKWLSDVWDSAKNERGMIDPTKKPEPKIPLLPPIKREAAPASHE